jgi:hypothetical protein
MKTLLNYLLNKQWILSIVMCFLSDGKKEQIYIARLRAELESWGYYTSDVTDKEIKDGIYKVSEVASRCGFTKQELAEVLKAMTNFTEQDFKSELKQSTNQTK